MLEILREGASKFQKSETKCAQTTILEMTGRYLESREAMLWMNAKR